MASGEIAVQIVAEGVGRLRHVQHHIGGHGPGVDTGVGAARADDVHRMALQRAQHGLQLPWMVSLSGWRSQPKKREPS